MIIFYVFKHLLELILLICCRSIGPAWRLVGCFCSLGDHASSRNFFIFAEFAIRGFAGVRLILRCLALRIIIFQAFFSFLLRTLIPEDF